MLSLDLIYVTTGRHPALEKLICEATNSDYAHAAIGIEIEGQYRIVEAVRPAVRIVDGSAFDNCQIKQVSSLPISEEQRQAVVNKVFDLVGTQYGVDDCIVSGLHDIFGDHAAALVDQLLNSEHTIQCSGAQVELVRVAFPDFAGECPGNYFTPEQSRQCAIAYAERLGVAA
ncbi:MAG: Permuted papain-like amidase enzyme, YaeF/YiiX, family [Firmicutes bacterium]|nr:Permuted papain-like amidase enzyme, YaeF/YiiX, family [Bacillota bacterium]